MSISPSGTPLYWIVRRGITSTPSSSAAVSARPWVSTMPQTTSMPSARSRFASRSMATVFPTPAAIPR